jgi:hypothetical protein
MIDEKRCIAKVFSKDRWCHSYQCSRKRGHGPDGKYCKIHDPKAVKARDDARDQKYREESEKRDIQYLQLALGRILYNAGFDTEEKVRRLVDFTRT